MGILLSRSHGVRPSAAHFLPEALNGIYRKDGTQPSAERTHFAFGIAEQWSLLARVIAVRPRGEQVEITCVAEHPAVHSADGSVDSSAAPI